MSNRIIPSGFVKSVLQNGVGRYVCQLQRVTFKFCKSYADSLGTRDFIENHLLEFTRANPGVVVYLKPRRHRSPVLVAEYLNGNTVSQSVKDLNKEEVGQWLEHLRCQSGQDIVRLRKTWHTDSPSIQGTWTPMTNRDSVDNMREYPSEELSRYKPKEISATEQLQTLAHQSKQTAS